MRWDKVLRSSLWNGPADERNHSRIDRTDAIHTHTHTWGQSCYNTHTQSLKIVSVSLVLSATAERQKATQGNHHPKGRGKAAADPEL